ncbi:MAG TPA: EAL domain-containing protein [Acidimicrobiales bacterium]|nr:EAL domain-containing protein [Acidimicrobiales bacterium]
MDVVVLVITALAVLVAVVAVVGWRREKAQRRKIAAVLHENLSERTSLRQAANVLDHMQIGVYVARLDDPRDARSLRLVAANPAASAVTGVRDADALGRRPEEAFPALAHLDLSDTLAEVVRSGVQITLDNVVTRDTAYAVHAFPLPDQGVGLTIEDITDRTLAEQRARHQALHDGLTGLPNRVLLVDRLQQAIDAGSRVAVVVLDIDQFKDVNATLGHHHGDLLLEQVARRLSIVVPETTTVARVGSDEFAVVLTGIEDETTALEAAQRLTDALDRPISLEGVPVDTRCTAGIALYPDHGDDADTLLKRAIMALIEADRSGVPRATYRPEHDRFSLRRLTLIAELRTALERDELVLQYQPNVPLRGDARLGVEALVRWHHPSMEVVGPDEFIELAEVSGLIHPLTRWVVTSAVAQCGRWRADGLDVNVSVNISARNFADAELTDVIASALTNAHVPPDRLVLEITESQLMSDPRTALEAMDRVTALGVRTSVDDFGTGYSSMSHLRRLPIDEIKIDQSFVTEMTRNESDRAIVRSIIDLGHSLGLDVVAEGVEDSATLAALVDMGCDRAQGYVLSAALAPEDLPAWVAGPNLVIDLTDSSTPH